MKAPTDSIVLSFGQKIMNFFLFYDFAYAISITPCGGRGKIMNIIVSCVIFSIAPNVIIPEILALQLVRFFD